MSSYNGNLYTLRAPSGELLPRTTIFLYGTDRFLLRDSLFNLARRTDDQLEVIVLHDGTIPNATYRSLSEAPAHLPLRLLEIEQPRGPSRAANAMLKTVTSDFVMLLEAGDTLQTDLSPILEDLLDTDDDTIGIYGDLEQDEHLLRGTSFENKTHLLSLLHEQTRLAPPLLRRSALIEHGRFPTDYPSEGWLLHDTALLLSLMDAGQVAYEPNIRIRRPSLPLDPRQKQDERALLNILLRKTSKRFALPFPT